MMIIIMHLEKKWQDSKVNTSAQLICIRECFDSTHASVPRVQRDSKHSTCCRRIERLVRNGLRSRKHSTPLHMLW